MTVQEIEENGASELPATVELKQQRIQLFKGKERGVLARHKGGNLGKTPIGEWAREWRRKSDGSHQDANVVEKNEKGRSKEVSWEKQAGKWRGKGVTCVEKKGYKPRIGMGRIPIGRNKKVTGRGGPGPWEQ